MDKYNVKSPPTADQPMAGKILLGVLFLLIIGSVGVTYWRIVIKKDYVIDAQADCDPTGDKCFIWKCDPNATDESEKCTGDPDKDTWYYQKASRKAAKVPTCDSNDENCKPWQCGENEADCSVTFCTDATKKADDTCSDPVQYNIDNPASDESATDGSSDATDENATTCDPASEDCSTDSNADTSVDANADTSNADQSQSGE